jgi:hypothetical protein
LTQLPFLAWQTPNQIRKLVYSFTEKTISINHTIFSQGQKPCYVYIIKEGHFQVSVKERKDPLNMSEEEKDQASRNLLGPVGKKQLTKNKNYNEKDIRICDISSG